MYVHVVMVIIEAAYEISKNPFHTPQHYRKSNGLWQNQTDHIEAKFNKDEQRACYQDTHHGFKISITKCLVRDRCKWRENMRSRS
jgi:hypothetical protein